MPSKLVMMTWNDDGPLFPSHDLPGTPVYPSHGLPGGGYPSHGLPGGGYPSHGLPGGPIHLPVFPFDPDARPDNSLPGGPGRPDNTLPGQGGNVDNTLPGGRGHISLQPIVPGARFIVRWIACIGLALVPDIDNSLPPTPGPKD